MSYKFVKVTTYYPEFTNTFYQQKPEVESLLYKEQFKLLMNEAFGCADFYSRELEKLGVEAFEIFSNVAPLQMAWAKENGSSAQGHALVFEQLKKLQPQVVLFQDSAQFNGEFVRKVRQEIKSVRLVIGNCCAPYPPAQVEAYREMDFFVACSPQFVNELSANGIKTQLIYHAFSPLVLQRIGQRPETASGDFIFTGSIVAGSGFHNLRKEVIEQLIIKGLNIDFRGAIKIPSRRQLRLMQMAYLVGNALKKAGLQSVAQRLPGVKKAGLLSGFPKKTEVSDTLKSLVQPPVYGLDMFRALQQAKTGFNVHIDAAGNYAANMRLFETTGVGTCLVTDWKQNMKTLFEPDTEVVTYRSAAECVEKVQWLLNHPKERESIAQAGQRRTLQQHNYTLRAHQLHDLISKALV